MSDKFVPHHAYGGREHDAKTPDPKCLLCQHDKQLEKIKAHLRLYSKGDVSAVGAVIAIRAVVENENDVLIPQENDPDPLPLKDVRR